jgi:CBS domain-containing protein/sporulation protein YlmC with PRC-barrel domain
VNTNSGARTSETELSLSLLLRHAVVDTKDKSLGRLEDAIIKLRGEEYPRLTGLVIGVGGSRIFVSIADVISIDFGSIRLRTAKLDLLPFTRRAGEILLKEDVLGHRVIDVAHTALVKVHDVRLKPSEGGWAAIGLDVHKHSWFHFGAHETHPARDWHDFLLLIGNPKALKTLPASRSIGRLKPAQIANIIEAASAQEQNLLMAQVHADPELEADVFEELGDAQQAQLLKNRSDQDVADVLSRMRADDVADAVMELPQARRLKVLELLPQSHNTKVLTLLGYHPATAGGLMGTDYLALSEDRTIADALDAVRRATGKQPEALTTIHSLRADGALSGTLSLVRALQLDPSMLLRDAADPDPVVAHPDYDIIAVTTRMADFNLLTLPVLDAAGRILGIVTVDDALEAAIPRDWSRREPGEPVLQRRAPERRAEA